MSLEGRAIEVEMLRTALNMSRIGTCLISSSEKVVMLAGGIASTLGTTDDRLLGNDCRSLLVPGLALHNGSHIFSLKSPEVTAEGRLTREDSTTAILIFQARTMKRGSEQFRLLTVNDISTFGVTRNQFLDVRRSIDALNAAAVISDARHTDCPIVYVSKRFEQLTGYPAEFAIGRNCRFLQGTDRDQAGRRKLAEAVRLRRGCHVLVRNYRSDGSMFLNELFISPVFDLSKTLTHYIGLQRECRRTALPNPALKS